MPAPSAAGVGEGSAGKVRAGARGRVWGTGAKEHPVPAAGCALGGGRPGREGKTGEARGGERRGLHPLPPLLLWGRRLSAPSCVRRVYPCPHAFAEVTSYREALESGSWAGVSASWGGDGLGEWDPQQGTGSPHPSAFHHYTSGFLRGKLARVERLLCTESHNTLISDSSTSR